MEELDFQLEPKDCEVRSDYRREKSISSRKQEQQMQEADLESVNRPV